MKIITTKIKINLYIYKNKIYILKNSVKVMYHPQFEETDIKIIYIQ
jgi:hypothetical protein